MRVLVTGAYGFIGSACLARLYRDGHDLVAAGRAIGTARRRFPYATWLEADFRRLTTADGSRALLAGVDAVVNCVGVLQDGAGDDVQRVQVATAAVFDACASLGIRRVVHVSAIGAEEGGPTPFARTKAAAEMHLKSLDLDWMILRPALILAPAAYGGTAMLRGIAGVPLVTPLVGAESRVQVVGIDDVAETVARALAPGAPAKVTWDLAHPQVHSLEGIVRALRDWLGFPPQPIVALPRTAVRLVTIIADALGWLGWRSPARSTALAQLEAGVVSDPGAWIKATGVRPQSLADILAARPSSVQERWFARLYFLKPLAIAALALFWIVTGIIAFGPGYSSAIAHFDKAGIGGAAAEMLVVGSAVFDIVLGLLLLVRRTARAALVIMLAATAGYVLAGTVLAPGLWIDPLGTLTKTVPLFVATLFTLAILDDR
jgi:uncharacterized protein YbjT (DUF2867 family)